MIYVRQKINQMIDREFEKHVYAATNKNFANK